MTGAVLHVDLDAFAANLAAIERRVAGAQTMLVIKDDAYGHGITRIVPTAVGRGIHWFGAFDVRTAIAARGLAGPDARIFSWLTVGDDEIRAALEADIDLGVGDVDFLERIADVSRGMGAVARVHLKIDTGLHRNGIRPEEWRAAVARARTHEQSGVIRVVGVWSHIAEASDAEDDTAREIFDGAVAVARDLGCLLEVRHLAASAASFARSEFRYDLVRVGAFAYGVRSAGGPAENELGIRPVASLTATVTSVGADAVRVALGSLDGLPSILSGRVSVGTPTGHRPLLAVESTQSSVGSWPEALAGDEVTIFGGAAVSATDLGEAIDTVGEEILVRLTKNIARSY